MISRNKKPTIGIIGAGGLCAAIQVQKQLGITPHIFEASKEVGGTWYHNRYPGCASDVPSHLYSLSFELNPYWSERYSPCYEIQAYLSNIAKKYQLYDHLSLETEVVEATWLDDHKQWRLDLRSRNNNNDAATAKSSVVYFDMIFVSVGSIRVPQIPEEFKGFQGTIVHTASWDPNVDFTNKRVAVVGSGSSAVQAIPKLARVASRLYSFQRTPAWVLFRRQYRYSRLMQFIFLWIPFVARIYRFVLFLTLELGYINFGYYQGRIARWLTKVFANEMRKRLEKQGRADLAPLLIPDYPLGCKRITVSEDYLETLCQDHVVVERSPIKEIKGRTIVTANGKEAQVDILCLATGFDVQGFLGNLKIRGKKPATTLNELWQNAFPDTYKSVLIHDYPNLFMILGPSSVLGHNSVVIMIECQVNFAIQVIRRAIKDKVRAVEPTKEAQDRFVERLKSDFRTTVWKGGCNSWYLNSQGDVTALWSSTVIRFWWMLRQKANMKDFITYK